MELQGELAEMGAECHYPHWNFSRTSELMIPAKSPTGSLMANDQDLFFRAYQEFKAKSKVKGKL